MQFDKHPCYRDNVTQGNPQSYCELGLVVGVTITNPASFLSRHPPEMEGFSTHSFGVKERSSSDERHKW